MTRTPLDEDGYDQARIGQWLSGTAQDRGLSRRAVLRTAALGAGVLGLSSLPGAAPATAAEPAAGPILKPLPPDVFTVFGTNAETRWEALRGTGYHVPTEKFFVRNHTSTSVVDRDTWRLRLFGTGLRGAPTREAPIELSYADLCRQPAETCSAFVECAGNGRRFCPEQHGQTVSGTAWRLGAVGVARWRGVRLGTVLRRAGLTRHAVDVPRSRWSSAAGPGPVMMAAVFEHPLRVRYVEADAQGVVFNGWYLTYFDEAMAAFLGSRGLPYPALLAAGVDVQLVRSEIDWTVGLRWPDEVRVAVSTARLGRTSFALDFRTRRAGADEVTCSARAVYVAVATDGSGKRELPPELVTALGPPAPLRPTP